MSKSISANLKTHIAGEVTTLATCWKLTLTDTTVLGFTNHPSDLVIDSVTYQASAGATPTSVATGADLRVDELQVMGFLDSTTITDADLLAGRFDYAEVEVFLVNYNAVSDGALTLRRGWLGEVQIKGGQFSAELRGITQHLQAAVGRTYSPACGADLGDSRCGVTLASFTVTGNVTSVTDASMFADTGRTEADNYFRHGLLTWTSGNNVGRSVEVAGFTNSTGEFSLYTAMPEAIQVGDAYSVYAGCDKAFATCKNKFSNVVNFRGFPHIPGADKMFEAPR